MTISHNTSRSWIDGATRWRLLLLCLSTALATAMAAENALPILTAEDVVNRMVQADEKRLSEFQGYTATSRYSLENKRVNKRAEMMVRVTCASTGARSFAVVSESGSNIIRTRVFRKLMEAEAEASQQDTRERNRIVPTNYEFRLAGSETTDGRLAHVLEILPKTQNRFLIRGRIWVDAEEYAISRIEGTPAKNPSFWTRSIRIVHRYGKTGPFWLPTLNQSRAEARIFGSTEVTIEYFDYFLNEAASSSAQAPRRAECCAGRAADAYRASGFRFCKLAAPLPPAIQSDQKNDSSEENRGWIPALAACQVSDTVKFEDSACPKAVRFSHSDFGLVI